MKQFELRCPDRNAKSDYLSPAFKQYLRGVAHDYFIFLIDHFVEYRDDAAFFVAFALFLDLLPDANRVADERRLHKTQAVQSVERDNRVSRLTHSHRQPGSD